VGPGKGKTIKKRAAGAAPSVPEGIPQTFNASWTRAGVTGMCSSRLAGEAMKWVTIAA